MSEARSLVSNVDGRMQKAVEHLEDDLRSLRTGRAQTSLVENLEIDQYGQMMPLKAVATITAPDARSITISPWDKAMVAQIEKMLRENQALGLNPASDGNNVRLNLPPMTEDQRRNIVKELGNKVEQAHIALRNIRHDVLNEIKKLEKDKQATQDDVKWAEGEMNKKIDAYNRKVSDIAKAKETEIMTV